MRLAAGAVGVKSQCRSGIPRRGDDKFTQTQFQGFRECNSHTASLESAGGVEGFILDEKLGQTKHAPQSVGGKERRISLSEGELKVGIINWQEFMPTP